MIRIVEDRDWPAVYSIYADYVANTNINFDWKPVSKQEFVESSKQNLKSYPFYIAEWEGEIIGYATAHPAFSKTAYQYDCELSIYFRPGPHFGMAERLLHTIEDTLFQQNIHWLISCITSDNEKSIAFHRRNGFEYQGCLEHAGYKAGAWHGVVWYGKVLKPADTFTPEMRFLPFETLDQTSRG